MTMDKLVTCYNEIKKILWDDIEPIQLIERYRLAPNLQVGILLDFTP